MDRCYHLNKRGKKVFTVGARDQNITRFTVWCADCGLGDTKDELGWIGSIDTLASFTDEELRRCWEGGGNEPNVYSLLSN